MRAELAKLTDEECPPLMAAATNDLDAKTQLRYLEQRADYLRQSLRSSEIVPPIEGEIDTVRFGTTVIVHESDGRESQYRIVGVDETDLARNWVSWISPIGKALMNSGVGQSVTVRTLSGLRTLEILSIRG